MQVILGANGAIARELLHALPTYTPDPIRLVSRQPRPLGPEAERLSADLTDSAQTDRAVAGTRVAYLVAGLPYDAAVWQRDWPRIMTNVLNACEKHGTRLVFFDNVYMYGAVAGPMTEATPFNPCSGKGEVRAHIARQLLEAMSAGRVQALIARAADFYGPATPNAVPNVLLTENYRRGKAGQWPGSLDEPHSLTFVPDAGRATALLGNQPAAYGQTWHLPTAAPALTARQFAGQLAAAYGQPARLWALPKLALRLGGLFNGQVREVIEMFYQYDRPYLFDSSKFEQQFFAPLSYAEGIRRTVLAEPPL